jgi:hypothetical protein
MRGRSYSYSRAGQSHSRRKAADPHHIEVLYLTSQSDSRIYTPVYSIAKVPGRNAMENSVVVPILLMVNFVMAKVS